MVVNVWGKGDLFRLKKFKEGDFQDYELYLSIFREEEIKEKIASVPKHIKISSLHNPTWVEVNERLHPFDLGHPGKIGSASLESLQKTIQLAKNLGAQTIVIHGAAYNPYLEEKAFAIQRVVDRVYPLFQDNIKLTFETDVLWHNLYYTRRALFTHKKDFLVLKDLLGEKLKITPDFEHLTLSFYFQSFIDHLGGEKAFLSNFSEVGQKKYETHFQRFVEENNKKLKEGLKEELDDFFKEFHKEIEHIHINGSDCSNYIFNPETTLPLIGEHLPICWQKGEVKDQNNYEHLATLMNNLPQEKEIGAVLEIWREDVDEFIEESIKSKKYLESYLRNTMGKKEKMTGTITLGNRKIRNFGRPFIIAEIGANHNGDLELAKKTIDAAKEAGADAVKFQSWSKDSLFSKQVYQGNQALENDIDRYALSLEQYRELKRYCASKDILFSTSMFCEEEVDFFMDELGLDFIKVASMDLNNLPFLEYMAKKGKPMILSTGLSTMAEIAEAVETVKKYNNDVIILHCLSVYPDESEGDDSIRGGMGKSATLSEEAGINLRNIDMFREVFNCPVGFSDNAPGLYIPLAAVARGACVIEKHFTFDKNLPGWDHSISADPSELKQIVEGGRKIAKSVGIYNRVLSEKEKGMIPIFRRSVVYTKDLNEGHTITREDLTFKRPGTGIPPKNVESLVGRKIKISVSGNTLVKKEDLE